MSLRAFKIATLAALTLGSTLSVRAVAAKPIVKMATLAPEGSVWDRILREMGAEWRQNTAQQVQLRIYAGGVAGDESDIVRKMRVGQLHAAAFSVAGLSAIDSSFEIFEIPMFFESYGELYHVLETLRPDFEQRLDAKGYVLLHWGNGGWVHLFSKAPIVTVDDLRRQKLFTGAGNEEMIQLWRENGFQPVALATTDLLSSLKTGIVDVVPTTPLAALSLQWFRETPHMQDLGLAPLMGATVISKRIWNRLTDESKQALRDAGAAAEKKFKEQIPTNDEEAVKQMSERGLKVSSVSASEAEKWRDAAEIFAKYKRENMEDKALLDRARKLRDEYRAKHGGK